QSASSRPNKPGSASTLRPRRVGPATVPGASYAITPQPRLIARDGHCGPADVSTACPHRSIHWTPENRRAWNREPRQSGLVSHLAEGTLANHGEGRVLNILPVRDAANKGQRIGGIRGWRQQPPSGGEGCVL